MDKITKSKLELNTKIHIVEVASQAFRKGLYESESFYCSIIGMSSEYRLTKLMGDGPVPWPHNTVGDDSNTDRINTGTSKWIDFIHKNYMVLKYDRKMRKLLFDDIIYCDDGVYLTKQHFKKTPEEEIKWAENHFKLLFPEGAFVRLEFCSPRDSTLITFPIKSIHEVKDCIESSSRAQGFIQEVVIKQLGLSARLIDVYLIPWNKFIPENKKYEFRTFVFNGKITAISSYYTSSIFENTFDVDNMYKKCMELFNDFSKKYSISSIDKKKPNNYGLDMFLMTGHECIIEVNPFGIDACMGSALFNWEKDYDQLYGKNKEIEIRMRFNK